MKQYRSVEDTFSAARQKQVRREIKAFLKAIHSYPDRSTRNRI